MAIRLQSFYNSIYICCIGLAFIPLVTSQGAPSGGSDGAGAVLVWMFVEMLMVLPWWGSLSLVGLCAFLIIWSAVTRWADVPTKQAWINGGLTVTKSDERDDAFPEGLQRWHGHYNGTSRRNNGQRNMDIFIQFHSEREGNRITGNGSDIEGHFTIEGVYSAVTLRVAFTKSYIGKHIVEYRGTRDQCRGLGFSGTWYIRTAAGNDNGTFRLWSLDLDWTRQSSVGALAPVESRVMIPAQTYRVTDNDECFICYHRAIDTCFFPCGHILACNQCASRLSTCPVCRTNIDTCTPLSALPSAPELTGNSSKSPRSDSRSAIQLSDVRVVYA